MSREKTGGAATRDGNILMVANYPPNVGYAWWLMRRFWQELADLGREVGVKTFLAYPSAGGVPDDVPDAGILPVVAPVPTRGLKVLAAVQLLRRLRIRNIYLTDRTYFWPGYALYKAAGVRRIVNHDHTPGDRPTMEGLRAMLKTRRNRAPWLHVDHWIALSPLMRQRAISNACIPPERVSVVPNGIEPIEPWSGARRYAIDQLGLPHDACIVATVGRAHPYKRIDFVVEVAASVERSDPDSRLCFVHIGDGPHLGELESRARDLGVAPPRLVFAGRRDDVRKILPGCDMAIHPSRGEGFSLAILEYMSAGLATLVPDNPSVSQAIDHRHTGIVYPDGDTASAVRELVGLEIDPETRRAMGGAARSFTTEFHSLERSTRVFRETMAPLLWAGDR